MSLTWTTPAGTVSGLCSDILAQPHLLIAGCSGSGKSVLVNSIIYTALYQTPDSLKLVLIDPKRTELIDYKHLPHTLKYASEPRDIIAVLEWSVAEMESRYKSMQRKKQKKYSGSHIYIVIDEFADLMTTQKKESLPLLQRLAQLGRAANMHLIAATQRPTKDIVNGQIKVNMDSRIALRCPTAQDSRNIINVNGAEQLPRVGFGLYLTPERFERVSIPYHSDEELHERVRWWTKQTGLLKRFLYS